jgi:hypothetical protein
LSSISFSVYASATASMADFGRTGVFAVVTHRA